MSKWVYLGIVGLVMSVGNAEAQVLWTDVTQSTIGQTGGWTHRVELADLDGDGDIDILFANGGDYSTPGTPEQNQAWLNDGAGNFTDVSAEVFGDSPDLTRVIKARDLNGDGHIDILVGATYGNASRLYLGGEGLSFTEVSGQLPGSQDSLGDVEFGDVDGDGDLDIGVIDWGSGDGLTNAGGNARIWLNDGNARFVESDGLPQVSIRMSWDLEFVDVDNDLDLDLLVASKIGQQNELFINDGAGKFTQASDRLPRFIGREDFSPIDMNRDGEPEANNYDFEAADLNGDGFLDLITVNDGDLVEPADMFHRREHIFFNDGRGGFVDATPDAWPDSENTGWDDNAVVIFDLESDGDADFLLASLSGPDRVLVNNGGVFTLHDPIMDDPSDTPGTLGVALGDLDGDGRLDLVQTQGEIAFDERVYIATDAMPKDSAPPIVALVGLSGTQLRARVHDNKSPQRPHDLRSVEARWDGGSTAMIWYGETLWAAEVPADVAGLEICGTDAAGNASCTPVGSDSVGKGDDIVTDGPQSDSGADGEGCSATGQQPTPWLLLLAGFIGLRMRRRSVAG